MAVTVRVLIADDHALVRRGTREILQQHPAIEVIGEAADGEEALLLIERDQPEVVLMDLGNRRHRVDPPTPRSASRKPWFTRF